MIISKLYKMCYTKHVSRGSNESEICECGDICIPNLHQGPALSPYLLRFFFFCYLHIQLCYGQLNGKLSRCIFSLSWCMLFVLCRKCGTKGPSSLDRAFHGNNGCEPSGVPLGGEDGQGMLVRSPPNFIAKGSQMIELWTLKINSKKNIGSQVQQSVQFGWSQFKIQRGSRCDQRWAPQGSLSLMFPKRAYQGKKLVVLTSHIRK